MRTCRVRFAVVAMVLATAGGVVTVADTPADAAVVSHEFGFTGGEQTWNVPAGVCRVTVDAFGAMGGFNSLSHSSRILQSPALTVAAVNQPGLGGSATATIDVVPGETLFVYVGGRGGNGASGTVTDEDGTGASSSGGDGGFNGGGDGENGTEIAVEFASFGGSIQLAAGTAAGGGGGASDVRRGGNTLDDRVVVAGGGGGAGARAWMQFASVSEDALNAEAIFQTSDEQAGGGGGGGGGSPGETGTESPAGVAGGGAAGSAGGGAGSGGAFPATAGGFGTGGTGASDGFSSTTDTGAQITGIVRVAGGGGGGGGWFGGGGGGIPTVFEDAYTGAPGGGGGGSGLAPGGAMETGVQSGDGGVVISYDPDAPSDCDAAPLATVTAAPRLAG
jgi:hypothetical protein